MDIDADKIRLAKRNAELYGVLHKIQFIVGDFFLMSGQIKGDVLVTSPPWGGPGYTKNKVISPSSLFVDKVLEVGRTMAAKMLLHLPKNMNKNEVCTLLSLNINYVYLCGSIIYILNFYSVFKCATELGCSCAELIMCTWTNF